MAFDPPHEIYKRRFSRNLGVGLTLLAFVALVFALTVVKVTRGEPMQSLDLQQTGDGMPEKVQE